MRGIRRPTRKIVTATACAAALGAAAGVPLATTAAAPAFAASSICTSPKHPVIAARISRGISAALAGRPGSFVGIATDDPADDLSCNLHNTNHFYAASVIKVTILSALLLKVGDPSHLTAAQRTLAYQMITQSSNSAAQTLWEEVGISHVQDFLNKAGMSETELNDAWGLTLITPHDELKLMQVLTDSTVISRGSRGYVLKLMSEVIASERWGVSEGATPAVTVHIKNGWLPYPGSGDWNINSIGAFTGTNILYDMAILTAPPSSSAGQGESYGIDTVQAVANVWNRDLAEWSHWPAAGVAARSTPFHAPGG